MPELVTITGPIAAGKNTVAAGLAASYDHDGRTAVIVDVDDVAAMVLGPGAGASGLWFAAHVAHGATVAGWLRSQADVVISVGPVYTRAEQAALDDGLPAGVRPFRVVLDAPLTVTWRRATADPARGMSRDRHFHETAHARYRTLLPDIPADLVLDSSDRSAAELVVAIRTAMRRGRGTAPPPDRG